MHELVEGHETPDRPPVAGLLSIVQAVPFHPSTSVPPTAVQALADGHDTAESLLGAAWEGLEIDTVNQPLPFHYSTSVPVTSFMPRWQPSGEQ